MLKPLGEWICDRCGKIIQSPIEGYGIWDTIENGQPCNFRIVHQSPCGVCVAKGSMDLTSFVGPDGLELLLAFLSHGAIKCKTEENSMFPPSDMDNFVDFFRRVQTPYYEEARTKFNNPDLLTDFSDEDELRPYLTSTLKKIIAKY
jgi:hypothetical protein